MINDLLIIDPQVDFCEKDGSVFISNSDNKTKKLGKLIKKISDQLKTVHVSLNIRNILNVSHHKMWINQENFHPRPFTQITTEDIESGKWKTENPKFLNIIKKYISKLETIEKYKFCVWPYHCLIGSRGSTITNPIFDELCDWEINKTETQINYILRGKNPYAEEFSVIKSSKSNNINKIFIESFKTSKYLFIAGFSFSHYIISTIKTISDHFSETENKKIIILLDLLNIDNECGFEMNYEKFLLDLKNKGVSIIYSSDI